ncbi:MAG: hypothetical protein V1794_05385, partial [Candidatus Glassbacteria bacterium]
MNKIFALCAFGFLAFSCCAPAPQALQKPPDVFETLDLHTRYKMKISNDCCAAAALVMRDGALVCEKYFGTLDRRPDAAPVTAESRFPLYSISKEFGV